MMTLEEMKLAVCEKLPELIQWRRGAIRWLRDDEPRVHWSTEGLQVCHEAEKLLVKKDKWAIYLQILCERVCAETDEPVNIDVETIWHMVNESYEQRLEALCRVWFPERF